MIKNKLKRSFLYETNKYVLFVYLFWINYKLENIGTNFFGNYFIYYFALEVSNY